MDKYYTRYMGRGKIDYPFSNFNDEMISCHILLGIWLLIHAGIKSIPR